MKKILSVALSTAMAFSMFASVAFGDTAVSPQQQFDALKAKGIFNGYPDGTAGLDKDMTRAEFAKVITKLLGLKEITGTLSYTDKNYTAKNWAVPYIEAVTAAGIMEGKNVEKKIFDFNGKVTVSEMATILTRALDLEIPAETNNSAADWAKGYVQAAINAGLIDSKANFGANASRELLVGAAYAIDQAQSLKVTKYEVSEGGKVVTFTISDGETVKVTLDKALEANKETEVKFTYKDKSFTEKVTYTVTTATKVVSATSTNLKEVEVAFDGKVNKANATDKANYSIEQGGKGIKSITLLQDGKTVRILLNESSKLVQGTSYKIVVKNVKADNGTVLPQAELSFTSADNTLPTVTEVKALGTKVIKVTFSEPIVAPSSSNFQLDDKTFVGNITPGANQREVILRDYTGSIAVGAHKLTTSLVEDFAGLKSLASTTDFTVAEDTEGPTVTEISATLEKVTVTFSEEIDPETVTNDSFYWKSGDSKKTGKATQIAANVYEVDFTENRLPGYETNLFVEVKDYSGNANAVKEHKVTASIDLVQPRIVETTFGIDKTNELTVRFDKAVDAADRKHFTIKKGDDVIPVKGVYAADETNKVFNVTFYQTPLEYGTYSLKIAGVQDKTALKNTMVEYNGSFVASDTANPTVDSSDYNNTTRKVTLNFGRDMDVASLNTKGNYYIEFAKNAADVDGTNISLPNEVTVNAVNTGKSVVLQFPEYINGTRVSFGPNGTVKAITTTGLKAKTGQVVSLSSADLNSEVNNRLTAVSAEQKDSKTFVVTFSQVVANANVGDFKVGNAYPSSVSIDGKKVTLKTSNEYTGSSTVYVSSNTLETYSGSRLYAEASLTTSNAISPKVAWSTNTDLAQNNKSVIIPFTAPLATQYNGTDVAGQIANDLIIKDLAVNNYKELTPVVDYKTELVEYNGVANSAVKVTFTNAYANPLSVKVRSGAQFTRAAADATKVAVESDVYTIAANKNVVENVTGTAKVTTVAQDAKPAVTAVPAVTAEGQSEGLKLIAKAPGTAGNIKVLIEDNVSGGVKVTPGKITFDKTVDSVANIIAAVNAEAANTAVLYKADPTPVSAVHPTVEVALTGGKEAVAAKPATPAIDGVVTIELSKAIGSIVEVKIGDDVLTGVLDANKTKITVNTGAVNVNGKTFTVKAKDANNNDITVSNIVAAN